MRMSIKGAQFLKIEEELKYVNQYLYIQKMRFQEHIICLVEIPEQLYEYYIPKLMIQPLLENAVYHGMEGMYEDGEIQLKIYAVNELVHIDVIDNGEGMTEAQVQKMMQGDVVASKRGSGIGVKNVNDRIKLYFGEAYGVQIISAPDEGTTARIYFPMRRQEDETEK